MITEDYRSDHSHILHTLVRVGVVQSIAVNNGVPVARVTYPDLDGMGSGELQIVQRNTVGTQDHSLPRVGERVVVLHMPNGHEDGFVLGSLQNPNVRSPITSKTARHVTFDDGSTVEFEPASGTLTVSANGPVNVTSTGTTTITAPNIKLSGNVEITGTMKVDQASTFQANITVQGNGTASGKWIDSTGSGVSA